MSSIVGNEALKDLFAIFHDGKVSLNCASAGCLDLIVDIKYLAERIKPGFRLFHIHLEGVGHLTFKPWRAETDTRDEVISDLKAIFDQDLEILYSRIEGSMLSISCNANADEIDYSGGELALEAISACVSDEAGEVYGLDQLQEICSGYWSDWEQKSRAMRQAKDQAGGKPTT